MARSDQKPRRPSRMTVPEGALALSRIVFAEAHRQCRRYDDFEFDAGVLRGTVKEWRKPWKLPRLLSLEAALSYLGWDLAALPFADEVPADLRHELEGVLARHAATLPALAFLRDVPAAPAS